MTVESHALHPPSKFPCETISFSFLSLQSPRETREAFAEERERGIIVIIKAI